FMVEMTETAAILHTATARSLILLDEVGRGTLTHDVLGIGGARLQYLDARVGRHRVSARSCARQDVVCDALFRTDRVGGAIEWSEELSRVRQRDRRQRSFSAPRRTGCGRPQLRYRSGKAGGIAERSRGPCARGAGGARIG